MNKWLLVLVLTLHNYKTVCLFITFKTSQYVWFKQYNCIIKPCSLAYLKAKNEKHLNIQTFLIICILKSVLIKKYCSVHKVFYRL